jgi:Lipase (class 3)
MPITDKDVADLCVGIYKYPGFPAVTWDRFDDGKDSDQICWGVKVVDGCDVLVFRGSTTFEDWRRDFDAWADPFGHAKIGPVHPGFLLGLDQVLAEYRHGASGKLLVAGHSLGAGRASIFCGARDRGRHGPGRARRVRRAASGISAACRPHLFNQGKPELPEREVWDVRA